MELVAVIYTTSEVCAWNCMVSQVDFFLISSEISFRMFNFVLPFQKFLQVVLDWGVEELLRSILLFFTTG
jgi:hypothetical protein